MQVPATLESLRAHWPDLPTDQLALIEQRLDEAWVEVLALYPDIPARITAGELSVATVQLVLHRMVKRAMTPQAQGMEGVQALTQGTGPFTQRLEFTGNDGWLGLKAADRRLLAPRRSSAVFTIHPTRVGP